MVRSGRKRTPRKQPIGGGGGGEPIRGRALRHENRVFKFLGCFCDFLKAPEVGSSSQKIDKSDHNCIFRNNSVTLCMPQVTSQTPNSVKFDNRDRIYTY